MVLRGLLDCGGTGILGDRRSVRRLHVAALDCDLAEFGGDLCVVDGRRDHA